MMLQFRTIVVMVLLKKVHFLVFKLKILSEVFDVEVQHLSRMMLDKGRIQHSSSYFWIFLWRVLNIGSSLLNRGKEQVFDVQVQYYSWSRYLNISAFSEKESWNFRPIDFEKPSGCWSLTFSVKFLMLKFSTCERLCLTERGWALAPVFWTEVHILSYFKYKSCLYIKENAKAPGFTAPKYCLYSCPKKIISSEKDSWNIIWFAFQKPFWCLSLTCWVKFLVLKFSTYEI